jgi:hypothetical protein
MDQKQLDSRGDATLMMLRAAAIERGMPLSGDDRMGECHAAKGVKRTSACALHMSAFDPKRTSAVQNPASQRTSDHLVCYRLIRQTKLARSLDALRVELCSMVSGASSSRFSQARR